MVASREHPAVQKRAAGVGVVAAEHYSVPQLVAKKPEPEMVVEVLGLKHNHPLSSISPEPGASPVLHLDLLPHNRRAAGVVILAR